MLHEAPRRFEQIHLGMRREASLGMPDENSIWGASWCIKELAKFYLAVFQKVSLTVHTDSLFLCQGGEGISAVLAETCLQ